MGMVLRFSTTLCTWVSAFNSAGRSITTRIRSIPR
jgi:hypothetical protein